MSLRACQHRGMSEKHSCAVSGGRAFWWTEALWAASEGLQVVQVPIEQIREFDEDCWFHGRAPSVARSPSTRAASSGRISATR